jgi:hypothetical protein
MLVYNNGCSHSRGACKLRQDWTHSYITCASLFGKNNFQVLSYDVVQPEPSNFSNYDKIFSKIKQGNNYLAFQPHFGKSNDRIFFESVNFLYESIQNNIKIDFAIIQWSGPSRTFVTVPSKGGGVKLVDVNPHDNPGGGLKFEPVGSTTTIQYMILLQDLYNKHNIPYVFIPYMEVDRETWKRYTLSKELDLSRFTTHPIEGHRNDFRSKGFTCDTHGHPSQLGSYILSSKTLDLFGYGESIIGIYDYFGKEYVKNEIVNEPALKDIKKHSHSLGDATNSIVKKLLGW